MNGIEHRLSQTLTGADLAAAVSRVREMPDYATEWELRTVAVGAEAAAVDAAIAALRTLRDPWSCPPEWLFLLAWDLSVDVWDADWPDSVKRAVCDASWEVHRYRGTRFAIETQLAALGLGVDLRPWYQLIPEGPRGTFEADVWIRDDNPIAPRSPSYGRLRATATDAITRTKPLTRQFAMRFGARNRERVYMGAAARLGGIVRTLALQPSDQSETFATAVAGVSATGGVRHVTGISA